MTAIYSVGVTVLTEDAIKVVSEGVIPSVATAATSPSLVNFAHRMVLYPAGITGFSPSL